MTDNSDVAWLEENGGNPVRGTVPAAKLHVLALAPLKEKLGAKWPRLSELVHKLFEAAITRAQQPGDYFAMFDELSYVAIFRNLSVGDANRVCAAIAREVCMALFGDQVEEVSVRSVVAAIVVPANLGSLHASNQIETILERDGTETVIAQSVHWDPPTPVTAVSGTVLKPQQPALRRIGAAHAQLAELGLKMGLVPIWDLHRMDSSSMFLALFSNGGERISAFGRQALEMDDHRQIEDVELVLLDAAAAYAVRISECQKVCAVCVGVSYKTLSGFKSRIRYITALQKVRLQPSAPLIVKVDQIPDGTPPARIGELAAMLKMANIRVALEFQSLRGIPKFDFRLNATALGGSFPKTLDRDVAVKLLKGAAETAAAQKLLMVLNHLDSDEAVQIAGQCNVRLGTGIGLGGHRFSGLEDIPDFPLTRNGTRVAAAS